MHKRENTKLVSLKDILPDALAGLTPSEAAVERCRRRMAELTSDVRRKDKTLRSVAKIKHAPRPEK